MDLAMVLLQRGVHTTLRAVDLPQAHQAAWTLLELLGVDPDTSQCPCLACGGANWHLAEINVVAGDHPQVTGRSGSGLGTDGDGSVSPAEGHRVSE
jgi:hypothetical protein